MGVSNHDRSSPVIDHAPKDQASFLEMEDDSYREHHSEASIRPSPPKRSHSTATASDEKHVSFATISVREYKQELGDHPCCSGGPPVSLGWEYTESPKVQVEDYEAERPCRRPRGSLRLSFETRREILKDVPDDQVRRVQRRLSRERCRDSKAMKRFFEAESVSE